MEQFCIHLGGMAWEGNHEPVNLCSKFGCCTVNDAGFTKNGTPIAVCNAPCPKREMPFVQPFDRVAVINLKRRPDRKEQMEKQFAKDWPFVTPIYSEAIDGKFCRHPEGYDQGDYAWACFQSHRRAIEDAINSGCNSVLILEDDAVLCEGFTEKAKKFMKDIPDDWEFAWLGGHHMKPPRAVKDGVVRSVHMDRCHAYAARGRGLMELYKYWHQWHTKGTGHCDWAISEWVAQFNSYCASPWIVGQGGGWSDIKFEHKTVEWWIDPSQFPVSVRVVQQPTAAVTGEPVGTELANILHEIGIGNNGCQLCIDFAQKMDNWGVAGCLSNQQEILDRLRQKSRERKWHENIMPGFFAVMSGLALQITDRNDPAPSLLRIAVNRVVSRKAAKNAN